MPLKIDDVEKMEKVSGQMEGLHKEISALARKSPNDDVNKFKLKFINSALEEANRVLGTTYKPFLDFSQFNEDDLPSNSDVAFIVGQYMEELETEEGRQHQKGYEPMDIRPIRLLEKNSNSPAQEDQ